MQIIKEIRLSRTETRTNSTKVDLPGGGHEWRDESKPYTVNTVGVIRTNTYAKTLDHVLELAAIAKQDFPNLADKDIRITHYGGSYYAGTFGLEFDLPEMTEAPTGHRPIQELELTK